MRELNLVDLEGIYHVVCYREWVRRSLLESAALSRVKLVQAEESPGSAG